MLSQKTEEQHGFSSAHGPAQGFRKRLCLNMQQAVFRFSLMAAVGLFPLLGWAGPGVDLEVTSSSPTNAVLLGEQFSFTITVSNASTTIATGVVLNDALPAGWQYIYSEVDQGTAVPAGNSVGFSLGDLSPGSAVNMRVFVLPQSPGAFTNTAVVSANEPISGSTGLAELGITVFLPAPPIITAQPQNQLLNLGGLLNLVVGVLSPPGTRYQWRLNGANIPGATNPSYSVLNLLAKDAGSYTVVVFNGLGATVSQAALVSLNGLLQLPASDSFETRAPLLNLLNLISYSNVGATGQPGEPLHAGVPGGRSVWFTWTPLLGGVVTFSTAGSSFDTLLAVYTGNNLTNLTEVASDDDSDGFYTSKVTFNAVAGTQYSIVVDGAYGAEGNIILSSSQQLLAPSVPRIVSGPQTQVTSLGGDATFTAVATGKALSYQWLFNDVALAGATAASLQISNVTAAQVGLYRVQVSSGSQTQRSAPAGLQIGIVDGQADPAGQARDKFQAEADAATGVTGLVLTKSGMRTLNTGGHIRRLSSGASRGYTGMQVFSTYGSATQSGEPNNCSTPGGSSSWTSLQPPENGALTIDTAGSNFKTILGVYTGNGADFSSLVNVACGVGANTATNNGRVTFAATANTVYYISVDGVDGAYGTVMLSWSLAVPPSIVSQPPSQSLSPGTNVTLNVTAAGNPAPRCQWFYNGSLLSGATNWSLTISNFQDYCQGRYQVLARNTSGSAATLPSDLLLNSQLRFACSPSSSSDNIAPQFLLVGVANSRYVIQASSDLVNWMPVATNNPSTGLWNFVDPQATSLRLRFYRAVPQ